MGRFINPFTDVGFKRIFGQEINKDLLIDFLNSLLEGEKKITDITFLDKELLPEFENDRSVIYDVYCTDESGEEFIVEMQNREHVNFKERAVYYLSRAIARQGEKGSEWMFNLKAVYGVFFMNFRMPDQQERKLRTDVELAERKTGKPFSKKMRFIFLELPAFEKEEDDCQNDFERWIYVLKHMETLKRMPFKARKSVFERLEQIVDIAALTKEEREKYDESIKVYRDHLATMAFAKQTGFDQGKEVGFAEGVEKGREEGLEQGREEGLEQGLEIGRTKGKEEGKKEEKMNIAREMKEGGMAVEMIAKYTGLDEEEIKNL